MTTLSPTEARKNLTSFLKRSIKGEDIGIVCGGRIVALRPVDVYSEDYALREYGVTEKELNAFAERMKKEIKKERRKGTIKVYSGDLETDIKD